MNALRNGCSLNTSSTTTRTVRILAWGRERRIVGLVPEHQALSCLRSDSAACIIVMIGRPELTNLSRVLGMFTLHARTHWSPPRGNLALLKATLDRALALFST